MRRLTVLFGVVFGFVFFVSRAPLLHAAVEDWQQGITLRLQAQPQADVALTLQDMVE